MEGEDENSDENSMEGEDEKFSFGFWKKIVLLFLVLLPLDAFFAWRLQIRYGDLLFAEGLIVFGAGAFAASGIANLRREAIGTTYGAMTGHPEGQKEFLEEERRKEWSSGIKLMIVGAIIIAVSIIETLV
jgi:hypothetical protein